MSQAAYERALRQAEKAALIERIAELETMLLSAHTEVFAPAEEPEVPPAELVTEDDFLQQHVHQLVSRISVFKRAERKAAKTAARERAAADAAAENERRQLDREHAVADAQAAWRCLLANETEAVLGALEAAFADNESAAAAINCVDGEAQVVMLASGPDLIPDQKPAVTPTGKPTLKKRTKSELNDLYVSFIASRALATVREAFAVAPALARVKLLVVRNESSAGLGRDHVVAIFAGTFSRSLIEQAQWHRLDLARVLDEVPDALIARKGRAGELQPLDLSNEPEIAGIVDRVKVGLESGEETA